MNFILVIIIAIIGFFFLRWLRKFKLPKIGSLTLISGGVKCGKSTLSVALVRREYKARLRKTKRINFFNKLFGRDLIPLPLVYSNVPLSMPYVALTDDLILRKKRFVYGSVIYIQEASLVADSQLIRNMDINERMLLFNKLIGHETKGGVLIYDTQTISDLHYTIKRSLSEYFYIHHLRKIPFFLIAYVQEYRYSEDNSVIGTHNVDLEDTLKRVIIPKSTWKYFDCYCYSVMTDDLQVEDTIIYNDLHTKNLKAENILSFRHNFKNKKGGKIDEMSNN